MSDDVTDDDDGVIVDNEILDAARVDLVRQIESYADGFSSTEGSIVTKFVCVAEVYTRDTGETMFMVINSDNLKSWERRGLLAEALEDTP